MPTLTLTVSEEIIRQLESQAEAAGRAPEDYASERFASALNLPETRLAPNTIWIKNEPVYVPPTAPPSWLQTIKPANSNALETVVGQWPGKETDDEISQALERLS